MNEGHDWTETDDVAALYLYRCPRGRLPLDVVANVLGIAVRSMKMRISNHRAIDTGEGLRNFSAKSRRVSETFGALSCAELEAELLSRVPALSTAENDAKGSA